MDLGKVNHILMRDFFVFFVFIVFIFLFELINQDFLSFLEVVLRVNIIVKVFLKNQGNYVLIKNHIFLSC